MYIVGNPKRTSHRDNWIKGLAAEGLKPIILPLEEVPDDEDWVSRERFWIARLPNLTNMSDGGEGSTGWKHSEETKAKIRQKLSEWGQARSGGIGKCGHQLSYKKRSGTDRMKGYCKICTNARAKELHPENHTGRNSGKTHCVWSHEYTERDFDGKGQRHCYTCAEQRYRGTHASQVKSD